MVSLETDIPMESQDIKTELMNSIYYKINGIYGHIYHTIQIGHQIVTRKFINLQQLKKQSQSLKLYLKH